MRWFSYSLSVRLFLIVLGGVILAITVSNVWHRGERARFIQEYREHNAADHLADVIRLLASSAPSDRQKAVQSLSPAEWMAGFDVKTFKEMREAPAVTAALEKSLGNSAKVEGAWRNSPGQCDDEPPVCPDTVVAKIHFQDGQAMWLGYQPHGQERPRPPVWVRLLNRYLLMIAVMAVVAWIVVRIALRPLQNMAEAAERFGRDINHPPIDEDGPCEVRQAAMAFNTMQRQILGYMAERTQILAAVAHDLKTPMTRLRLRLESCPDEVLKEKLRADLAAMQSLVDEGLELAHSMDADEPPQAVDLDALLQSLCDDAADTGLDVAYESGGDSIVVPGQANALRRVFENIIDNALKYGHYARVVLGRSGNKAQIYIRDGGPGIPNEQLEAVLKPFFRLESSRSRETGGTGLGLAIAINLLKTHQGELQLRNMPEGGLEASVQLPISRI